MKILIAYNSKTGNTKKLATGIYQTLRTQLPQHQIICTPINRLKSINGFDVILVGYWVDKGGPNKEATKFMKTIKNTKVGIFATLGEQPDSKHGMKALLRGEALVKQNNNVIGKFACQGAVSPKVLTFFKMLNHIDKNPKLKGKFNDEFIKNHALTPEKAKMYKLGAMHPNELDIKYASALFKERMLERIIL
ncbi:MAG: hypothetical protein BEN18_05650 [Epulopiscium sp. Nuni2H_MBin001]|nr:MAG: hypothetical protein BEN18_05650 [Epulopiscium sp. Nuni2H_MBin001]